MKVHESDFVAQLHFHVSLIFLTENFLMSKSFMKLFPFLLSTAENFFIILKFCYRISSEHEKELYTESHLLSLGSKASTGYTIIFTTSSMA